MEESDYLRREPDASDKRAMVIEPTKRGLKALREVQKIVHEIETDYVEILGEAEMQNLRAALLQLTEAQKNRRAVS